MFIPEKRLRLVGVDVGQKRVGLAWSDPTRSIATTIGTFNQEQAVAELVQRRNDFSEIVIGWPIDLNGQEGEAVVRTIAYESRLKKALPDKIFYRFDERFTSTIALQNIRNSGLGRQARSEKALVDGVAASILVQNYLDYLKR